LYYIRQAGLNVVVVVVLYKAGLEVVVVVLYKAGLEIVVVVLYI